jgi:tripartite-type tricarboxylate transporter receptor subunit TctC
MTFDITRRGFLATGAAAATLPIIGEQASAQAAYPTKPIRIVVGYPAGGQTDIIARTYGEYISRTLGQPVVVENKAGAGGIIGAVEVKRSPPDGYTMMVTISTTMVGNRVTVKNLPYDADKDFTFVASLTQVGLVMAASQKTGASNLKEFVEYAKKADKVSMGTYAAGSTAHMIIVELNKQYGLNIEAVHYRGEAPMWADINGQVLDAAIGSYNAALPVLQGGRGKAVGVTGLQRLTPPPETQPAPGGGQAAGGVGIQNVQTLVEQGAKSELYGLRGYTCFTVPAGTPPEIVKKLSDTIVAGGKDPKLNETMGQFFLNPPIGHEEAQKLYNEQTPKWVAFMEGMGLKAE